MLEGFHVVNFQTGIPYVSLTSNGLTFNKASILQMQNPAQVVLLLNEARKQFAIQRCAPDDPNAMPFYRPRSTGLVTVRWSQKELLHTIARMMGQSLTDNYRVNGQYIEQEGAMVFDLNEAYRVEASSAPVRR